MGVAGDVNGDGFHAVIVDAEGAETNGSERCQISGGCDGRLCRQVRARDWGLQRRWIRWVGGLPRRVRFDDQYLGRYVMKLLRTLRSNTGVIMSLPFSPDSQRLASGSRDHTIKMLVTTRWCSPDPTRTRL